MFNCTDTAKIWLIIIAAIAYTLGALVILTHLTSQQEPALNRANTNIITERNAKCLN